jgi:hypothetical protein
MGAISFVARKQGLQKHPSDEVTSFHAIAIWDI